LRADCKNSFLMFIKSSTSNQLNLFTGTHTLLTNRALKQYEDNQMWHNQFRTHVTGRIDETVLRPLFCENFGAPNAPIRILVGMMVLKEAQGWSDAQLFEACLYNLLVRSALGLMNLNDAIPATSTYYLLRKRIVDWEEEGHENLMEKIFSQITKSQALEFHVNGKKIRMDSKLMGSNIAWYSRYQLIHETLSQVYHRFKSEIDRLLSETEIQLLKEISGESGDKVCYRSTTAEIEAKMTAIGVVIQKMISQIGNHSSSFVQTLCRVFNEQYQVVDDAVHPRDKKQISASSVQSPHDPDCHYRKKGDQQVKGYSINITETCDKEQSLNLVSCVQVETASAADCDFLQPAIEKSQQVIGGKVETVNTDGAYHSVDNQGYCQEKGVDLVTGAIQGQPSRYDLNKDAKGQLMVTDLTTDTTIVARPVASHKEGAEQKWAIRNEKGKNRYFTQKEIDTCLLRKQIAARGQAEINVRNNVEATIFQLGYHYSNAKSRYRGMIKHKMWANARCLWINFVRILNFVAEGGSICEQIRKNRQMLPVFMLKFVKLRYIVSSVRIFSLTLPHRRFWAVL